MIRLILYVTLTLCYFHAEAQQVSFKTYSGAKQVVSGSTFDITFSIENGDEKNFKPPSFTPFKRIAGPSQSYQSSFVNGRSSKSISYAYTLQATKLGTFQIEGAVATINGKLMKSNSIQIEVVKQSQALAKGDASKIFIRAELDTNQLFVGQQVILKYKIYTQVNVENYNIIAESSYDGCYTQVLDAYKDRAIKEVINGEEFTTKVLRKIAVFPQQNGKITIDPLAVRVGIPDRTQRRRSFFSSFNLKTKNISSNAVDLFVQSPHQSAPQDFTGAVGSFQGKFSLTPNKLTTDEVINLRLKIIGSGDVKMIRPPMIELPEGMESYDPKVLDEKMITTNDSVRGEKLIEYLLIGNQPGKYLLKPKFTFLSTDSGTFVTLQDSFAVTIDQGKNLAQSDNRLSLAREDQFAGPMMSTDLWRVRKPLISTPWYWSAVGLPLLGFLFLTWRNYRKQRMAGEASVDHTAIAQERLASAKQHLDNQASNEFFAELALCIKNYLASKVNMPIAELSKAVIHKSLNDADVGGEAITRLISVLDQCDFALYAGIHDPDRMEATYRDAVEIIRHLELEIP